MNNLPLNGDKLTNHLTRLLGAGTTTADSGGLRRALSGSGGDRTGYRVAQEIPDDSTLSYLDDRPANIVRRTLQNPW